MNHQTSPNNVIINDDLLSAANNGISDISDFNSNNNNPSMFFNNFIEFKGFLPLNLKKEENYLSNTAIKVNSNIEENSIDMKDFY